jgi:hypothetical protein
METPPSRSDSENLDAWESRLARIPLASPPPDLRAACLKAHDSRPAPRDGSTLWHTLWQTLWNEHRWALHGLAAVWAVILGLQLTTPEIPVSVAASRTAMTDETLEFLARQREELMASMRDGEVSDLQGEEEPRPSVRRPSSAFPGPRSDTLSTNRMS